MANASKAKNKKRIATSRDVQIFQYLWRWKTLSTRAISKKFFPKANPYSTYIRLTRLHKAGYIEPVEVEGAGMEVWTLAQRGFRKIRPHMVELELDGYKSENHYHDFIATAFHLGEWLINPPTDAQTFSEQQLRRLSQDLWPEWIPHSDTHRPDGYSRIIRDGHSFTFAFEAELSMKAKSRYEKTVAFYDSQTGINLVFWLVSSKGIFNAIKKAFEKYNVRHWQKHHFILLEDFRKNGWSTTFFEGELKGHALGNVLGYNTATTRLPYRYSCSVHEMLDSRKRPMQSTPSQTPATSK